MTRNTRSASYRRNSGRLLVSAIAVLALAVVASQSLHANSPAQQGTEQQADLSLRLTSSAFDPDGAIPAKYACSGANVSPALAWTDPPAATQSFVLIVDDPDAPAATPAVHWLIYAIPAAARSLPEGTPTKPNLPDGSHQGKNSAGKVGYRGPCPDPGKVHHYFFKLYALDYVPSLKAKASVADVEATIKDHVLAKAELIARFQRE